MTCLLESLEQVFLCSHFSLLTLYGDLSKWLCNKSLSYLRISTVFSALLKAKAVAYASIPISRKHLIRYVLSSRKKCWGLNIEIMLTAFSIMIEAFSYFFF